MMRYLRQELFLAASRAAKTTQPTVDHVKLLTPTNVSAKNARHVAKLRHKKHRDDTLIKLQREVEYHRRSKYELQLRVAALEKELHILQQERQTIEVQHQEKRDEKAQQQLTMLLELEQELISKEEAVNKLYKEKKVSKDALKSVEEQLKKLQHKIEEKKNEMS